MSILMLYIHMNLRLKTPSKIIKNLEFDEDGKLYTRLYKKSDDWFPYSKLSIFK